MIDTRPFPAARSVGRLLPPWRAPTDRELAARWGQAGDHAIWLSRSSWGMAALVDAFQARAGRPPRAWLPEYFCDQALWPMRQRDVDVSFYPVDERGWPDWRGIAVDDPPDLFFLVHFYGHRSDTLGARAFCDASGALLVEDATHALGPDDAIGHAGDVVFYSPWKFFEVPNGAAMLVRPRAAAWIEPVTAALAGLGSGVSRGLAWMKQAVLVKLPGNDQRAGLSGCGRGDFFADAPVAPMAQRPRASPVAAALLAGVALAESAARRRTNDAAIRDYFADVAGWQPFDGTPAHGPLRAAFRLDSPDRADAAHRALRHAGIRAEGWPGLPPEVSATSRAADLRRTVLNLPCHQGLTPRVLLAALDRSGVAGLS